MLEGGQLCECDDYRYRLFKEALMYPEQQHEDPTAQLMSLVLNLFFHGIKTLLSDIKSDLADKIFFPSTTRINPYWSDTIFKILLPNTKSMESPCSNIFTERNGISELGRTFFSKKVFYLRKI
jgi:hypothetical protein